MIKKLFKILFESYFGLSKENWLLLAAGFVNAMGLMLVIYITLFLNNLHYSPKLIGIFFLFFGVAGVAGGYCGGIFSDRLTPLFVCKLSLILSSFFIAIFPFVQNYYLLHAVAVCFSFFSNLFRPAFIVAISSDQESHSLTSLVAIRRVAINLGMAAGAVVGGILGSLHYTYVFIFNSVACILSFLIIININSKKTISSDLKIKSNDCKIQKNVIFYLLILLFFVLLVFNQIQVIYPLYLKNNLSFNEKNISILFAINGVFIAFLQLPLTKALQSVRSHFVFGAGALLVCLGFGILSFVPSFLGVVFSVVIWTFGEMVFFPSHLAFLIQSSSSQKGKYVGWYQAVFSFAVLLSPLIGTWCYSYNVNLIWYLCSFLSIIIFALLIYAKFYVPSNKKKFILPQP